jgi:ABC-type Mn2+/Zn2+ transport system ATPase subunit
VFPDLADHGHAVRYFQWEDYAMISIKNLRLIIEGREILKGIDMHLEPGKIYELLGPDGADKSITIFNMFEFYNLTDSDSRIVDLTRIDKFLAIFIKYFS